MAGDNDPKPTNPKEDNDDDIFYDPLFDEFNFTEDEIQNLMSDDNPTLMDLSFPNNPNPLPPPPPPTPSTDISETRVLQDLSLSSVSNYETADEFIGFDEDYSDILELLNDDVNTNVIEEEIGVVEASTRVLDISDRPNFEIGGPSTRPVTIAPPTSEGIFLCTCCNRLREIVHTNGQIMMTLDICGGNDFFCHAVLEYLQYATNERRHQTIHLNGLRMEDVINYIEEYFRERGSGGFEIAYDSNSALHQAGNVCSNTSQTPFLLQPPQGDIPMSLAMRNEDLRVPLVPLYVGLRDEPKKKKVKEGRQTALAAQRERTSKLTLRDLSEHFRLPIEEAARRINICPTVVKKVCRKGGLLRWPHRKIKSIERKISSLKSMLRTTKDPGARARTEAEIERFENEINEICSDILRQFRD